MIKEDLVYKIAIMLIPGIGSVLGKKILAYTGSAENVFKEKKKNLLKIPGIGESLANVIINQDVLKDAEKEVEFIQKFNISPVFCTDKEYPERLKYCQDSPLMLFVKGPANLNNKKILSIVGTRKATNYGKEICEKLVEELAIKHPGVIIVSGLAYGIDIAAHKAALKYHLPTVAVLAHGLSRIYPSMHTSVAKEICTSGALITEFLSNDIAEKNNFVKRNRIIAGISDATIVVESGEKGGALITADIANSYDREVFAFPGRIRDNYSKGCNWLIKTNKAALVENISDIEYLLRWDASENNPKQIEFFTELTELEKRVLHILKEEKELDIESLCDKTQLALNKVSPILLSLEFAGLIKSLPGRVYRSVF